jgi:hypothetical protein
MSFLDIQDEALLILAIHEGPPGAELSSADKQRGDTRPLLSASDSTSSFIRENMSRFARYVLLGVPVRLVCIPSNENISLGR